MERENSILYFSGSFDFKSRQWFKGVNTDAKKKKKCLWDAHRLSFKTYGVTWVPKGVSPYLWSQSSEMPEIEMDPYSLPFVSLAEQMLCAVLSS